LLPAGVVGVALTVGVGVRVGVRVGVGVLVGVEVAGRGVLVGVAATVAQRTEYSLYDIRDELA
jgi:hypothetical protein